MEYSVQKNENERIAVDIMDYFRILRKNAGFILITALIFALAAFVVSKKNQTVGYTATTRVLIQGEGEIDGCVRIVKSEYVLKKAAEKLSENPDGKAADLRRDISCSVLEDTRVLEISAFALDAEEAAKMARTVRDTAIERLDELLDKMVYRVKDRDGDSTVIKLGKLADIGLVETIDDVGEPVLTSNINIKKNVLFFALLGLILPAGLLGLRFLAHELSRPIKRPEDIINFLGEEVLSAVPERKYCAKKVVETDDIEKNICLSVGENDGAGMEAVRLLRTNLTALSPTGKVFSFTGTFEGDGASSVAFYTAKSLADIDKKVLYIDADTGNAAERGKNDFPGLCELMDSEAEFDEAALKTEYGGLYVMAVGDTSKASGEMFVKPYFKAMLAQCRKEYDYVILNTPPAGRGIDSSIIGRECDGAVYAIRSDAVSRAMAQTLLEQMKKAGCNVVGTVLTGADMKNDPYYGKYYYSYRGKGGAVKEAKGR